jgi:hypothetical protein
MVTTESGFWRRRIIMPSNVRLLLFSCVFLGILVWFIGLHNNRAEVSSGMPKGKNLDVRLALNKSDYTEGDPIEISISFSNLGREAIRLSTELIWDRNVLVFETSGTGLELLPDEGTRVSVGPLIYLDANKTYKERILLQDYLTCRGTGAFRVRWKIIMPYYYDRDLKTLPPDEGLHVTCINLPRIGSKTRGSKLLPSWPDICDLIKSLLRSYSRHDRECVHQGELTFMVYPLKKESKEEKKGIVWKKRR